MRLVVTGGGTGGHIYPALEVGRLVVENGAVLHYFGSLRGQEQKITANLGISFQGFPSEPLYSVRTLRGLKAAVNLQRARLMARKALKLTAPDVVFSTGGYSAGPVVAAARDLGIPYTIHTADSVPARSSRMFAKQAAAFSCTFRSTIDRMPDISVVRTGQPIRKALRQAAQFIEDKPPMVLVVGGSQGSKFLNENVPQMAIVGGFDVRVLHLTGLANIESTRKFVSGLGISDRYEVVPFLNADEMTEAYLHSTVVIGRSGGTLAELALFGLPSVLVPLPDSANNHQFHNAMEFVGMGAATLMPQAEITPETLHQSVMAWVGNSERRNAAREVLSKWDVPDATERIVELINQAAK